MKIGITNINFWARVRERIKDLRSKEYTNYLENIKILFQNLKIPIP